MDAQFDVIARECERACVCETDGFFWNASNNHKYLLCARRFPAMPDLSSREKI